MRYRLLHIPTLGLHLHVVNEEGKERIKKRFLQVGRPLYMLQYLDGTFALRLYHEKEAEFAVNVDEFVWTEVDDD